MSDPQAAKTPAPPPAAPPKALELMEMSLTALINAPGVFARLDARPMPGPGTSFLTALVWGAAFLALKLIHIALSSPAALQAFAPWQVGAICLLGLGVWTALCLLGSSFVYALGRTLGSGGDFDRALLVVAVTLAAAPAQALCAWFPLAWIAPSVVAAWIAACGLGVLFKANPWAARGVCAVLAAAALAVQYGAGLAAERYSGAARFAAAAAQSIPSADQIAVLQQQMQSVQTAAEAASQPVEPGRQAPSGLDLLRGPAGEAAPATGPSQQQQLAQMSAAGDAMNKSVVDMLGTFSPMLNNPMLTQNMMPAQKADFNELKGMIRDLKTDIASKKITSSQEQQAKMLKIQNLVMRLMSSGMTIPEPPAAPAPRAKR